MNVQPREPPTDVLLIISIATEANLMPEQDGLDTNMSDFRHTSDLNLHEGQCSENPDPTCDVAMSPGR